MEEEGKREITEKGQVGMESTDHWTWGCGCHRTCIHNLIKQEFEKSKTEQNRERERDVGYTRNRGEGGWHRICSF